MGRRVLIVAAFAGLAFAVAAMVWLHLGSNAPSVEERWALLDRYCVDCHSTAEMAGDLSFEGRHPTQVSEDPELWERVIRKLSGGLMPPPGSARPGHEETGEFVTALATSLDAAATTERNPGYVPVHRLNRREYAAAVEELLALRIDPAQYLPNDLTSDGFDNIADVLRISPAFFDQYMAAARQISIQALGNPNAPMDRKIHIATRENQGRHIDGLPLGTRGGVLARHMFPADGEYVFAIDVGSIPGDELRAYPDGWIEFRHRVILTIDGDKVFEDELGGPDDSRAIDQQQIGAYYRIKDRFSHIRVPVTAGLHEIGATFVARTFAESDKLLKPIVPGLGERSIPRIRSVEIVGPYEATGIGGTTAGRQRILICEPATEADRLPCAEEILGRLAHQAFRQPVTESDLGTLLQFYRDGEASGGFETGIRRGIMAILASPKFLFRTPEPPPGGLSPGDTYPISELELASRLSFFLWGRGPDERLLMLAEEGALDSSENLIAEVERMLADPRSRSLVTDFAFQWLALDGLDAIDPDPRLFPDFDEDLRAAFLTEMELYLDSILRADRSVLELFDAKHTYVNERLARLYGIRDVRGDRFRYVEIGDPRRWGLFGKGALLMLTSYPHRTSPVLRGIWIMEHLLATPPSPPPPGVETDLEAVVVDGGRPSSVRERLEVHRADPSCNHCHGVIDPLGMALENFNAIGEWREFERQDGIAIDASGELSDGTPVDGAESLREALLARPERLLGALTEKLMTYALGRRLEYYDMPTVRSIVRTVTNGGEYRFSELIQAIVLTDAFRMRRVPEDAPAGLAAAPASDGRRD
jgi:hypothetical protein